MRRKVNVVLGFEIEVEDTGNERVPAQTVGGEFCRIGIQTLGQIGNPSWIATPLAVVFLRAEDADEA